MTVRPRAAADGHRQGRRPGPVAGALVLAVRAYRVVSGLLPPRCRFAPTCSAYAVEALEVHGAVRGSWLAVRRVARCHPFHPGGHDPVPPSRAGVLQDLDAPSGPLGDDGGRTVAAAARPASLPTPAPPALPLGARS